MTQTKKKDFVALWYTGYSEGKPFDSNIAEDLKKLDEKAEAKEKVIIVGEGMLVKGFDKALEGKEVGKEHEISLTAKEGFGERNRDLIKVVPIKAFHSQKVDPQPGMVFALDNSLAKVLAVSGARVTLDLNHPLAGKPVKYKFKIERIVEDINEKCKAVFESLFRFLPEFEVKDAEVIVRGPKGMDMFVNALNDKFKELIGKPMKFEEKDIKIEDKKQEKEHVHDENCNHEHEGHEHSH